jgi:hypothetical protein
MSPEDPQDNPGTDDERSADELSDDEVVDVLPEDLDATGAELVTFPNNDRRRIPAVIYLIMGLAALVASIARDGSPYVNRGLATAGALLAIFGIFGLFAGRTLVQDETDALVAATAQVGFPVGHASAQMAWKGLLSRPVWRLLVYSDENPPKTRAMVVVNGIDGRVEEWFAEDNPEEWSEAGASDSAELKA